MKRRLLDAGSGPLSGSSQQIRAAVFGGWDLVRLDIDPGVKPDKLGSITELPKLFNSAEFDALWTSHVLEHLNDHQVQSTLDGCYRVLKRDGFAIFTCPDLRQIAKFVLSEGVTKPAYHSPAGPIGALDMMFGHRASIARGQIHMAHRTGFTAERLSQCLGEAGFAQIWAVEGPAFDLWAIALMPQASAAKIRSQLASTSLNFLMQTPK